MKEELASKGLVQSLEIALFIATLVDPNLLLRVPSDDRYNAAKLLDHLEILCKHFRLLDLPLELRQLVYTECLPEADPCGENDLLEISCGDAVVVKLPALSQTSRQVRQEFLELYLGCRKMCLCITDYWIGFEEDREEWAAEFEKLIRGWGGRSQWTFPDFCAVSLFTSAA